MSGLKTIRFVLNGESVSAEIAPHHSLVELLQEQFGLYGARESCGQGLCGCCTVNVNNLPVSGCLYLAAFVEGADVRTIEGLAENQELHPVQSAFIEAAAFQCGFCTPGFILQTEKLLEENPEPSEQQIRDCLSGNLCRCGCYPEIVNAVQLAAKRMKSDRALSSE